MRITEVVILKSINEIMALAEGDGVYTATYYRCDGTLRTTRRFTDEVAFQRHIETEQRLDRV